MFLWSKLQCLVKGSQRDRAIISSACLGDVFFWTLRLSSHIHRDDFDPVSVDVSEEDTGSPLDDIDQLVDALSAALALPVRLVQEQRLEELLPQPPALQHQHSLLWKPGNTESEEEVCSHVGFRCMARRQSS